MLTESQVLLNKVAQSKISLGDALRWFHYLDTKDQRRVLDTLLMFVQQAHPSEVAVSLAIETAPTTRLVTPVVLLKTYSVEIALNKISQLPASENINTFSILLRLFQVADTFRRENECVGGCSHEWHNLIN